MPAVRGWEVALLPCGAGEAVPVPCRCARESLEHRGLMTATCTPCTGPTPTCCAHANLPKLGQGYVEDGDQERGLRVPGQKTAKRDSMGARSKGARRAGGQRVPGARVPGERAGKGCQEQGACSTSLSPVSHSLACICPPALLAPRPVFCVP